MPFHGFIGKIINDFTGGSAVDEAKRQAQSSEDFQRDVFDLLRELFDQGLSAVDTARGAGEFDAGRIRELLNKDVDVLLENIKTQNIISGTNPGDTKSAENIAKGLIRGGQVLGNAGTIALNRELSALRGIPTDLTGAAGNVGAAGLAGQQGVANARLLQQQRTGQLIGAGLQFLRRPQFGGTAQNNSIQTGGTFRGTVLP